MYRIYLTKTVEDAENIKYQYVILKIDTRNILNITLRKDINYIKGFYISTNIPPYAISIEKEL